MRDGINEEFDREEAPASAWWVPLLPAAACIGLGIVVLALSLLS